MESIVEKNQVLMVTTAKLNETVSLLFSLFLVFEIEF